MAESPAGDPGVGTPERRLSDEEFRELDRRSIRTGCETADNREADRLLRAHGYVFDAEAQGWTRVEVEPSTPKELA